MSVFQDWLNKEQLIRNRAQWGEEEVPSKGQSEASKIEEANTQSPDRVVCAFRQGSICAGLQSHEGKQEWLMGWGVGELHGHPLVCYFLCASVEMRQVNSETQS